MDLVVVQLNMAIQVVVDLVEVLVLKCTDTGPQLLVHLVVDRVLDQVVLVEVL